MLRPRVLAMLLVLITLMAYLPVLQNCFLDFDDGTYLTNNSNVQNGITWPAVKWAFSTFYCSNWHPLTWIALMVDYQLFRLNPAGHHLINVLIHCANVYLLFFLTLRLTEKLWPSVFVAGLFAWHPLHVESVAWIAELKDVTSTFWGLISLLAYVCYVKTGEQKVTTSAASPNNASQLSRPVLPNRYYWLALAAFFVSLMFKSMLVTLPFVMLLLDFWPFKRIHNWKKLTLCIGEKILFLAGAAGASLLTFMAQRPKAMASLAEITLDARLKNVVIAYASYLYKLIWPVNLAIMYPFSVDISWWKFGCSAAFLALISAAVCWQARKQPWLPIGWLWYLGTLVPVIGLVQVGSQSMADRYTYFPMIGLSLAVVLTVRHCADRFHIPRSFFAIFGLAILCGCLVRLEDQLRHWRNTQTVFSHALAITQNNPVCHLILGGIYLDQNQLDKALQEYYQALELNKDRPETYDIIGQVMALEGKPAEATDYFRAAIQLNPKSPTFHDSLGIALVELGRLDEAEHEFAEAIHQQPDYAPAHFQMARTLLKQNKSSEAVKYFHQALALAPNNLQMLTYVARVMATDKDAAGRNGTEACNFALQAHQLRGGKQPSVLDTLAAAYAETGQFDKAVETQTLAIKTAEDSSSNSAEDITAMRQRLALYQNKQPYRESFGKN